MSPIGIFAVVVNLWPLDICVEDGGEGAIDINGKDNRSYEPNRGKRSIGKQRVQDFGILTIIR